MLLTGRDGGCGRKADDLLTYEHYLIFILFFVKFKNQQCTQKKLNYDNKNKETNLPLSQVQKMTQSYIFR